MPDCILIPTFADPHVTFCLEITECDNRWCGVTGCQIMSFENVDERKLSSMLSESHVFSHAYKNFISCYKS
jgi:hypothetical protein